MKLTKPALTFAQIINMNVGFFGIQYSFGLQQSAVNPIYDFLGASPEQIPILNLAGPMTGLLIQPLIGAISDKTWHPRFGRRKPFFFIGAVFCSLCLFLYPFSSTLWMAGGLLWVLDAANNTAMEPYRALIADKLPPEQLPTGFLTQSFFTGLGITLANISLFIFQKNEFLKAEHGRIPYWVFASFFLGSVCSIGSVAWSIYKTPEIPPTPEELAELRARPGGFINTFKEIGEAIGHMPRVMWQLALVYLFQWYALFCYWQNASKSIAQSVWKTTPMGNRRLYEEAVGWTGLVNGWYNVVTFLSAFVLVGLAKKFTPRLVHFCCLLLAGTGLLIFPHIENKFLLFAPMTGFGIAWASMMGVPYLMVVNDIPKEKYGVYMGIINMMIVVPMILQNITFGFVLKHFLGNDSGKAIGFAGALLLLAAGATLIIKKGEKLSSDAMPLMPAGH